MSISIVVHSPGSATGTLRSALTRAGSCDSRILARDVPIDSQVPDDPTDGHTTRLRVLNGFPQSLPVEAEFGGA